MKPQAGRVVTCPNCKGTSLYSSDNAYRPFCSERCKNMDFGAWANEAYRVASKPSPDEDDGAEPSPAAH